MKDGSQRDITRRAFLDYTVRGIGAFMTVVVGIPVIGYAVSPALSGKKAPEWVQLGEPSEFKPGEPSAVKFTTFVKDAWMENSVERTVYVVTANGQDFTVWNPRCTHLGCAVFFDSQDRVFKSPCHGGEFDPINGKVLAGPPPRPLDSLPTKIEDGKLFCQYMDFRLGVPEKVPL